MNRSRIRGGGRKPFRQKGTGRARAGSTRSPIWRHGAVAHGPQPRDYSKKVPRRIKRLAYKCVLTDKVREGRLVVIDDMNLDAIKTRSMVDFIANVAQQVPEDRKRLLVTRESNHNVYYSARNIPEVNVIPSNNLSIYELVKADRVVFSKDALEKVVEVLSK
jgi:large subunit ribosomal protein L4